MADFIPDDPAPVDPVSEPGNSPAEAGACTSIDIEALHREYLRHARDYEFETVLPVLRRLQEKKKCRIDGIRFEGGMTEVHIVPCLFKPTHKKAVIEINAHGRISYLCWADSCFGRKGHQRKTWYDVVALLRS
jgi:hypothetical protein